MESIAKSNNRDQAHLKCQVIIGEDTCDRLAIATFKCVVSVKADEDVIEDVIEDIRVCDRHAETFKLMKEEHYANN